MENKDVTEPCECLNWARDGRQKIFTEHHYNCEQHDLEEDAHKMIKDLLNGIEVWAHDEDGVHPKCWDAYKRAKYSIGEFDFKTTEND